jgi:hypothetical protein
MRLPPLLLSLAAVLLASPRQAEASACCGSGHGLGQRLNRGEDVALTLSLRFADRIGSHGMAGQFYAIPSGAFDGDGRAELAGIFAPTARLQLGFSLPFVLNVRQFGQESAAGGGIGDISASARFDLVPLATSNVWPAIAITTHLALPTGRSASDANDTLAVDATGLGVAELRPGVFVEKSFSGRASAIFAASVGLRFASADVRGEPVQLGPRLRLVAAAGPVTENGLSLSIGLIHELESAPSFGGVTTVDADRRRTAALAFVGVDLGTHFTLLGSLEADLPLQLVGKNEPAAIAISIGLRRSFSWEN